MARQSSANQPSPPEWWKPSLYRYLEKLTLAGWVWEFMRRDRLKTLRLGEPVDVMNPHRGGKETSEHLRYYYKPWHLWPYPGRSGKVFTIPSAIMWEGVLLPWWVRHTWLSLNSYELENHTLASDPLPSQWVQISIDLNRSDAVILQDLEIALKKARKKYPRKRVNPKMERWRENQILEVWDLCEFSQFKNSWSKIAKLPGMFEGKEEEHPYDHDIYVRQSARNAYHTARKLIEGRNWKLYALQVADLLPQNRRADKPALELVEQAIEQSWQDSALQALDTALDEQSANNEL